MWQGKTTSSLLSPLKGVVSLDDGSAALVGASVLPVFSLSLSQIC